MIFLFNYKELFKLYNNRLYFLIIYKNTVRTSWSMGELFLRKYTTSFNYDLKIVSFYKQQVDEMNKKTDEYYSEEYPDEINVKPNKDEKLPLSIFVIIIILTVIIIVLVIVIIILVREWKKGKKSRVNEVNDDYEYISKNIN